MQTSEFNWREFPGKKSDGPDNCPRFEQHDKPQAQPKPLTAAEIEELKRKWAYLRAKHTSMTADEIRALTDEVIDTSPVLLSMLTPPPDAAVREAVEHVDEGTSRRHNSDYVGFQVGHLRTLLSYVRAVQSPRLTGEQRELLVHLEDRLATTDTMWPKEKKSLWYRLRAAFPEAFAGEVGRG